MKYLLSILVVFQLHAIEIKPQQQKLKNQRLLHYGDMFLVSVKTTGELFTPEMPRAVRSTDYLHEIVGKKHYWNWGKCKKKNTKLTCKQFLEYGDQEFFRILWKFNRGKLTETIFYYKDGSSIEATWQGKLQKTEAYYYEWDLTVAQLGF